MRTKLIERSVVAGVAVVFAVTHLASGRTATASPDPSSPPSAITAEAGSPTTESPPSQLAAALAAFRNAVNPLSDPRALETAFGSYFAFRSAHPERVHKPLLYFVDYGLPSTARRGYVFDMEKLQIIDGPFTVAHGRGSSATRNGVPTRFSNLPGSNATSLGLYVAQELYSFSGKAGGRAYSSVGMRLDGVSRGYNDNARRRRVVAHGAPYVTPSAAGRSEGCPAMEPARARRLLPRLADGGMVFLFAPESSWLAGDPWVTATAE